MDEYITISCEGKEVEGMSCMAMSISPYIDEVKEDDK